MTQTKTIPTDLMSSHINYLYGSTTEEKAQSLCMQQPNCNQCPASHCCPFDR